MITVILICHIHCERVKLSCYFWREDSNETCLVTYQTLLSKKSTSLCEANYKVEVVRSFLNQSQKRSVLGEGKKERNFYYLMFPNRFMR